MKLWSTLLVLLLVNVSLLSSDQGINSHPSQSTFTYEQTSKASLKYKEVTTIISNKTTSLLEESYNNPIVLINYLGSGCKHCVAQLNEFKKHTNKFKQVGAKIIAISPDELEKSQLFFTSKEFDPTVFSYISDPNWNVASSIGFVKANLKEQTLLHGIRILYKGNILFGVTGLTPFMGVSTVLDHIAPAIEKANTSLEKNIAIENWNVSTVLTENDGILRPIDLDFNSSYFNSNDLWVVNSANNGFHTVTIAHDIATPKQSIVSKADSRRGHFMWRTQGIAFGTNGTFATAQNGQQGTYLGVNYDQYLFMGPTLWSADTAIFASKHQGVTPMLGSHLDMLHQSPFNLGIAHDNGNKYWVSDARYNDICSYDFQNPHEVGGTDHRDGIIRRYKDVSVNTGNYGIPAHLVLDKESNWLYYIDAGNKQVKRLDIKSGAVGEELDMPPFSAELIQSYKEVIGGIVEIVVPASTETPVGIDIRDGILYVSYYDTGNIRLYSIQNNFSEIETISTNSPGVMGLKVSQNGEIWVVNHDNSSVLKISRTEPILLTKLNEILLVQKNKLYTIPVTITNEKSTKDTIALALTKSKLSDWVITFPEELIVDGNDSKTFNVTVESNDISNAFSFSVIAVSADKLRTTHTQFEVVSIDAERYYVNDATMEIFDVSTSLSEIDKLNYIEVSTQMFTQTFKQYENFKTVVWNSGTFGDVSAIDRAAINDLVTSKVDILFIADDPINILRLDDDNTTFLTTFGATYSDIDTTTNQDVNRKYLLEQNSGIFEFNAISEIPIELFPLFHHKGKGYIPTPLFSSNQTWSKALLKEETTSLATAIMGEQTNLRTILWGFNLGLIPNQALKNELLLRSITWLEGGSAQTSVSELESKNVSVTISQNPLPENAIITIQTKQELTSVRMRLFNSTGALVSTLGEFPQIGNTITVAISSKQLSNGVYYIVTEWNGGSTLLVVVKQQ